MQMIQNMVAAIRAYGMAMVFADQSPEKLTMLAAIKEYSADYPDPNRLRDCLRLSLKRRLLLVGPAGLRAEELG